MTDLLAHLFEQEIDLDGVYLPRSLLQRLAHDGKLCDQATFAQHFKQQ